MFVDMATVWFRTIRVSHDPKPGPRYAALLQILKTSETLWNVSREFFARWEVSPAQFNTLNLVHGAPKGMSQSDLSRALITHRSNVTGLVDRLEKRGLVSRGEQAADRRVWTVRITPAGRRLLEEILPEYYRLGEEVWGGMALGEATRVDAILRELNDNALRMEPRASEKLQEP
jgi:DNA-binding MarR family transcriptional regulator